MVGKSRGRIGVKRKRGEREKGVTRGQGTISQVKRWGKNRGVGSSGTRSFPLPQMDENTEKTAYGGNPRRCLGC